MERHELISGVWDDDIDRHPEMSYTYTAPCGYMCEIKRNNLWAYCGFVTIPYDHTYYDSSYDTLPHIDVHGGLTFGYNGKFGFDCSHSDDIVPGTVTYRSKYPHIFKTPAKNLKYWTFEQVMEEINSMAQQFYNLKN